MSTQESKVAVGDGGGRLREKGDLRSLGPWYGVEFLNSYGSTLLTAGSYDYATRELKASPSGVLWLSAAWGLAYIFISLSAGRISERWGPRRSVMTMSGACALTGVAGLAALWVPHVWVLGLVMLGYNMTSSTIWPAAESALTRSPGRMRLSTRMIVYNLSWGSAGFAAFFTRGALEHLWWGLIFVLPATAGFLGMWVVKIWGIPAAQLVGARDDAGRAEGADGALELDEPGMRARAEILLKMAWVGNALAYVAINVMIPMQMRLANLAGVKELAAAGMITAVWGLMRFAGFATLWKWTGWHYKVRWLMGAQTALAASFCMVMMVHSPVVLVGMQVVFGLSAALIYSSSLYYAMHVSSGHGGHAGIHEALIGLGIMAGPTVGALAGHGEIGPDAIWRVAVGVTTVMAIGIGVMGWMGFKAMRH